MIFFTKYSIKSHSISVQGCGSATRFCDFSTKKKIQKTCSHLVTWQTVAPAGIKLGETQNLCFVDYTKCRSTLLIWIWILAFCQCTTLFFLPYSVEPNLQVTLTLVVSRSRRLHENFVVPFLHVLSPLYKALVEKPMFVQVGSICTSHLSSGTALQQDFVIRKVVWKHFMMNILAAVHFA